MLTGLGFKPNQQTCSNSLSSFEILQELDPTFHLNKFSGLCSIDCCNSLLTGFFLFESYRMFWLIVHNTVFFQSVQTIVSFTGVLRGLSWYVRKLNLLIFFKLALQMSIFVVKYIYCPLYLFVYFNVLFYWCCVTDLSLLHVFRVFKGFSTRVIAKWALSKMIIVFINSFILC